MRRRLHRWEKDKMVAGVCSGLAKYFDVDVLIIRLAVVALTISKFYLGLIAYTLAVMVMPVQGKEDRPEVEVVHHPHGEERRGGKRTLAMALIAVGAVLLAVNLLPQVPFFAKFLPAVKASLWPLVLIILGVVVLTRR